MLSRQGVENQGSFVLWWACQCTLNQLHARDGGGEVQLLIPKSGMMHLRRLVESLQSAFHRNENYKKNYDLVQKSEKCPRQTFEFRSIFIDITLGFLILYLSFKTSYSPS